MSTLHFPHVDKEAVSSALRHYAADDAEKRGTLAPLYFPGGVLLITLVVLPLVWRVVEFVPLP